jgi:hypothetical protein
MTDEDSVRLSRAVPPVAVTTGLVLTVIGLSGAGTAAHAAGGAGHYTLTKAADAFTNTTKVVRWAPCTRIAGVTRTHVIRYRINPAGQRGRVTLVQRAVAKLTAASGLTFHYVGTTSYIPHFDSHGFLAAAQQQRVTGVPFVIGWAFEGSGARHSNLLTGTEAGVGTISWKSSSVSQLRIVAGAVVIKRGGTAALKPGFRAGGSIGTLLLHELGHAVGLQHVYTDIGQVMYPIIGPGSPAGYAAGDRAGLAKVGRPAGCMTTPSSPI